MKKKVFILLGVLVLAVAEYFLASKLAIRHETFAWMDTTRDRPVTVDIAVRRDVEMKAMAGILKLPVAVVSHGNTVKNTEYSFLANVLAARGYLVASIQHDLPTDKPLMTKQGSLYVGRLGVYERGMQNIFFALGELKNVMPNADYEHLTLVGHSNGGDISMFFAQQHPNMVRRVVTLDNLRVPFVTSGRGAHSVVPVEGPAVQDRSRRAARSRVRQGGRNRHRFHRFPAHRHERPRPRKREGKDPEHARPIPRQGRIQRNRSGRYPEAWAGRSPGDGSIAMEQIRRRRF